MANSAKEKKINNFKLVTKNYTYCLNKQLNDICATVVTKQNITNNPINLHKNTRI